MDLTRAPVRVRTVGYFEGQHEPTRPSQTVFCPICFGPMSNGASLCVVCSGRINAEKQRNDPYNEEKMDRHHRWTAMLELGFTNRELIRMRPFLPSQEQIEELRLMAGLENTRKETV